MITFVGNGTLSATISSATVTVRAPTCEVGDILLCALINKTHSNNFIDPPDGTWTQIIESANDCDIGDDDHVYAIFWHRAVGGDSGADFLFTKAVNDGGTLAGVISAWRGCKANGDPIDASGALATETTSQTEVVTFPEYTPTASYARILRFAFYGNDLVSYPSTEDNPVNFDLETSVGTDGAIACQSFDNFDAATIPSGTMDSNSTTDAGNTGVILGLVTGGYLPFKRKLPLPHVLR